VVAAVTDLFEEGITLFDGLVIESSLLGGMGLGEERLDAGLFSTPLPVVAG